MRKELAAALAAGVMLVGGAVFTANSAMAVTTCPTYESPVSKPDSGHNGDWATVAFKRTVELCKTDNNDQDGVTSYTATFTDNGTFAATEGANSPGTEPVKILPKGVTGKFVGGATFTFTTTGDLDLEGLTGFTTDGSWPSTSEWIGTWLADKGFVSGSYAEGGNAWGWTYTTDCEKWVNSGAKEEGNITKVCETPPPPAPKACEAYNYYQTTENLCAAFPGDPKPDPNCKDVGYQVTLIDLKMDPWSLDGNDNDGLGCESYPVKGATSSPTPTGTPTASPTVSPTTSHPGNGGGGTTSPSQTTDPAVDPTTSNVAGGLPVTGESGGIAKLVGMLSVGGILISIGGLMFMWARRRRDAGTVESA